MDILDYLAIPYRLEVQTVVKGNVWKRRAAYPELPNCEVEHDSVLEALVLLEQLRVRLISQFLQDGQPIPAPRQPLRDYDVIAELDEIGLLEEVASKFDLKH